MDDATQQKVVRIAFDRFAQSSGDHAVMDCAQYGFIRPLGLVLAHEGKNRVALFRVLDLPYIPAVVQEEGYPSPDRMRIFEIGGEVFAVLDDRYVELLHTVELGRQLLAAYGVPFDSAWPGEYPALDRVRDAFIEQRLVDSIGTPTVDLARLALEEAVDKTEVTVALADVADIRWPRPKSLLIVAGLAPVLMAAMGFAKSYSTLLNILSFLLGGIFMMFSLPFVDAVGCRVEALRERVRWHHKHEVRRELELQQRRHRVASSCAADQ
ncbi:hypothetical protein [Rugamonas sp. DEMB1]|uniref:hypothetical protein n=1 Tax=Rugamonas sp. DEMB1 TaxID=3039386 RepID=UPI002448471A|nr:hypothetical protein [Rugamonas sp. DEMB1]WGG52115.1 hypothetical protein QC826_08040 [Rugamonas sp. DEMB1]